MNIIVIGAGYGGITAALRLARLFRKQPTCIIHLVDRNPYHTLKTQLHEAAVLGAEVTIPIERIIRNRNIRFHLGNVESIDLDCHLLRVGELPLPFDYLVFALGSQVNFYDIPGLEEYSFPLQSVADAQRIYQHIDTLCNLAARELPSDRRQAMLRFVIGGGGLSGVEFATELAGRVPLCTPGSKELAPLPVEVILIEGAERILSTMAADMVAHIERKLHDQGIRILTNTFITSLSPEKVALSTGEAIETRTLIWTGGIQVKRLAGASGLAAGAMGRIIVDAFLRAESHPGIYAIGDNALASNPETGNPVPAAAQFALQQGRLVADNIYSAVTGGKQKPYTPKVLGEIVSLGRHLAVGWMALPFFKKITFIGFLARLLKTASQEKHIFLLRKESRHWISY